LTITAGSSGSGSGTVSYSVAANTSTSSRSATMTIAGQTFTVSQAAATADTTPPTVSMTSPSAGTTVSGTLTLTASASDNVGVSRVDFYCDSTVVGSKSSAPYSVSWNTAVAGNGSHGFAAMAYDAAGNATKSTYNMVTFNNPCTYSISPTSASSGSGGGFGSVSMNAGTGCSWSTSSGASWITVTAGTSGSGNGTVSYSVAANTAGSSRSGTVTIAGQTFTVNQSGVSCSYTLASTSASFASSGGSGSVNVTATAGCVWVSTSGASWITINSGSAVTGSGSVSYSVAANTSTSSRSGTMTIASQTFTVNQAAAAPAGDTTPPTVSLTAPSAGSTISGTVTLSASASDNVGVSRVDFYCDSTVVGSATAAPYSLSWASTQAANGSHGVWAKAYDAAGNSSSSSSSTVTVNNNTVAPPASGNCIWSKHFGGTVASVDSALALAIKEDHTGSAVVVGKFFGSVNFGGGSLTSAGNEDIFVMKSDSSGNFQWARRCGSIGTDIATGVAIDSANNIVVVGYFGNTVDFGGTSLTSAGSWDIFVVKYNPSGTLLWAKRFGGTGGETCNGVALDAADNIFITGYYGYSGTAVDFGGGPLPLPGGTAAMAEDVYVAKLTSSGGYVWAKGYGAATGYDVGNGIALDASGNVAVVGSFQGSLNLGGSTLTSAGGSDVFVAEYSGSTGAHLWSVSGGGSGNDLGRAVAVDASGNVVITGEYVGTASIAGTTITAPYNPGTSSMFVAKYSSTGTGVWAQRFAPRSSNGVASGRGVAIDSAGNIALTGYVEGSVVFGSVALGMGSPTIMLAKLSGAGSVVWAKGTGGSGLSDIGEGVTVGAGDNILATGHFADPIDFGGGSMTSVCQGDGFIAKLSP
jgi:hypothetical protein